MTRIKNPKHTLKPILIMKSLYLFSKTIKIRYILLFLLINSINSLAGPPPSCGRCLPRPGGRPGGRIAAEATLSQSKTLQTFDISALNLKETPYSAARMASAISIDLVDFNTISAVGNSWLLYHGGDASFTMNIGIANNTSPQTWTLPANLLNYFTGAGRSDFVATSSVPTPLQIAGANKTMLTYYLDNVGFPMKVYDHFDINSSGIDHIGTSYDLEFGDDDTFDEPNYEFSDVPLDLGDTFTSTIEEEDYVTNLTLTKYIQTSTTDAYGIISTPDGTFNCLRMSLNTQKYTRPNESTAYTLVSTTNQVNFVTKEGAYFNAEVSAKSGTATLSNFQYRKTVLTSLLSEFNDVKINNNSKGITINTDDALAHPSAILDIKTDSLGVLIPRIVRANRPTNPATGLLIYQIDNTPGFYYFDGSAWQRMNNTVSMSIESNARVAERWQGSEPLPALKSGRSELQNGTTFIRFDQIQENFNDLMINLQLEGDCNGLFISEKTKEGFWVKELQKGKSNVKFRYALKLD